MSYRLKLIIFQIFVFWGHFILPSILEGTLVKTPKGLVPVENIIVGDTLVGCLENEQDVNTAVVSITSTTIDKITIIKTAKGELYAASDQLLFDCVKNEWIVAQDIIDGMHLFDSQFNSCACLNVEQITIAPMKAYKIFTTHPHNFFVFEQDLLTHNFIPFIGLGVTFLFGGGAVEFGGLTLLASVASIVFGVNVFKRHAKSGGSFHVEPINNGNSGGGGGKEPNNDKNSDSRICNTVAKTTFFKKMKDHYRYWRDNSYRRKHGAKGLDKKVEYIKWDHLHNDVEAYDKGGRHLGSYDPETLQLYKSPDSLNYLNIR